MVKASISRKTEFPADKLFVDRWSPRAMSGADVPEKELMVLFEAARWAPSSYNNQSWRMLYARRGTPQWQTFFDLLGDFNKGWCNNAAALVVFISKKTFDHNQKSTRTHSFDTGAAWENFALQGSLKGLVVHGMEGFDYDRARQVLKIPEEYQVEAMAAVGRPGDKDKLPAELKEREAPSDRKKLADIVREGTFTF